MMAYYQKYIKYKSKYLNLQNTSIFGVNTNISNNVLQHGGQNKKTSYWDNKSGDLFYHPKYGILYQITHYATDGGPTYHLKDGTQVHQNTFIWKPNPKLNPKDDFLKDLQKIGTYSGSNQYINPEKKQFPELVGKTTNDAMS